LRLPRRISVSLPHISTQVDDGGANKSNRTSFIGGESSTGKSFVCVDPLLNNSDLEWLEGGVYYPLQNSLSLSASRPQPESRQMHAFPNAQVLQKPAEGSTFCISDWASYEQPRFANFDEVQMQGLNKSGFPSTSQRDFLNGRKFKIPIPGNQGADCSRQFPCVILATTGDPDWSQKMPPSEMDQISERISEYRFAYKVPRKETRPKLCSKHAAKAVLAGKLPDAIWNLALAAAHNDADWAATLFAADQNRMRLGHLSSQGSQSSLLSSQSSIMNGANQILPSLQSPVFGALGCFGQSVQSWQQSQSSTLGASGHPLTAIVWDNNIGEIVYLKSHMLPFSKCGDSTSTNTQFTKCVPAINISSPH